MCTANHCSDNLIQKKKNFGTTLMPPYLQLDTSFPGKHRQTFS